MAVSDEDGTAERLAQTRAERRHIRRLRTAERRDAAHERGAERRAELETETGYDPLTTPSMSSADTRELLAAEQDALALERGSLVADCGPEDDREMDII
ncbi:hypothetical protein M6B22_07115 [Jatrophihabitans cynanchi]|uniref:TraR/DksA family transcriptional regulator n=1 Tax=Jatrophihabitans cynanchi TaxID=2944128 RepID=A0ABY7K134_9ACTN|nr:hypothetical protein [Jatrophihabitans sp. SB3-54]WAX58527.1 hypothetical protein M6B22_07115 [Jatrophihabitans sp. SB3-54]